jgi:hypothetical protein
MNVVCFTRDFREAQGPPVLVTVEISESFETQTFCGCKVDDWEQLFHVRVQALCRTLWWRLGRLKPLRNSSFVTILHYFSKNEFRELSIPCQEGK